MVEIDKDNIPEQVSKRIRRYIDNPRFTPDETVKYSRYGQSSPQESPYCEPVKTNLTKLTTHKPEPITPLCPQHGPYATAYHGRAMIINQSMIDR